MRRADTLSGVLTLPPADWSRDLRLHLGGALPSTTAVGDGDSDLTGTAAHAFGQHIRSPRPPQPLTGRRRTRAPRR